MEYLPTRLCLRNKNLHCFRTCLRTPTRTVKYQVVSLRGFIRSSLEYIMLVIMVIQKKKRCSVGFKSSGDMDHSERSLLQTSPTDIERTVRKLRKCCIASTLWIPSVRMHLPISDRPDGHHSLQRPARTKRCWFNLLIGLLSAKHHVPHCGMTDPHGENPGAVSILHGDGKSNHLANGVGSDGGELCSVTLITLTHITKSADCLQTSPTDIAGTVRKLRKCCIASTSWIPSVRKCQLCVHIFHLTHCDSQASFFACGMRSIYITNAYVWRRLQRTLLGHLAVFLSAA